MRRGQRFELGGHSWRVLYVNGSRAHCLCTDKQDVTIGQRHFVACSTRTLDISPNSEVAVLSELSRAAGRKEER